VSKDQTYKVRWKCPCGHKNKWVWWLDENTPEIPLDTATCEGCDRTYAVELRTVKFRVRK